MKPLLWLPPSSCWRELYFIAPLFLTIKQATETLRRAKEDLEIKVAERTGRNCARPMPTCP